MPFVLRILGSERISTRLRASLLEIDQTIPAWPQLASAVALGGGLAAEAVRRILLGQEAPSGRYYFDLEEALNPRPGWAPMVPSTWARSAVLAPLSSIPAPEAAVSLDKDLVRRFVSQACLAPSGGNAQPWLWRWDDRTLALFRDPGRSSGLIDFEHTGSYVPLGAAAESLRLAARNEGLETLVRRFPDSGSSIHTASFHFFEAPVAGVEERWGDSLSVHLGARHTNRGLGDGRPLATCALDMLTAAV
ncbi:MAG: Rv1355c family protein, partial [Vicinamibacteria bacterium]